MKLGTFSVHELTRYNPVFSVYFFNTNGALTSSLEINVPQHMLTLCARKNDDFDENYVCS